MKDELEKYKDSVYMINKIGGLNKIELPSLDYYNHFNAELHHYIKFSDYVQDPKWYEERNIKQKTNFVTKVMPRASTQYRRNIRWSFST